MPLEPDSHPPETGGEPDEIQRDRPFFPIVGVGASAGGLEAFTQFLTGLPGDTGMAFVMIQHLDPRHESQLTGILSRATTMLVQEACHGMVVEPNHVYVITRTPASLFMTARCD